jgi:hypothetical protein
MPRFLEPAQVIAPIIPKASVLLGDGTWKFQAEIEGDDILVRGVTATWFGGSNDPNDSGQTASGFATRGHPSLLGCALPMDGRMFPKFSAAEHKALDGSPIPAMPFGINRDGSPNPNGAMVEVTAVNGRKITVPVIDLGPGKRAGDAIDLTQEAFVQLADLDGKDIDRARELRKGVLRVDYRIIGGAKYVKEGASAHA